MLCLYSVGIVSFHLWHGVGKWVLLFVLTAWFVVQFLCHWRYTIFGASEKNSVVTMNASGARFD